MKNTFSYLKEEACTKISVKMDNLEHISAVLDEIPKYIEENIKIYADKEGLFNVVFEEIDDNNQVLNTIKKVVFFEQIIKKYPEIRQQILGYVKSLPVEKLKDTTIGLDAVTALSLFDPIYYKNFVEFFKRTNISKEQEYRIKELTNSLNRIFATQHCDKAMMKLLMGFDELFFLAVDNIVLPTDIPKELFNYLLKITLEQNKNEIGDDIWNTPFYIHEAFGKVSPYRNFFECEEETDLGGRFKKAIQAGNIPTYDSLLGIKNKPTFYSANENGVEVIVDINKEEEVKKVIELLCQLFKENKKDIAYNITFGKQLGPNLFEQSHNENDFFSYVIEHYPNLHDALNDYAFMLSDELGDDDWGLPQGISIITDLAQTNKKYIKYFERFLLSRDLNHPSSGWQEIGYVDAVLSTWDWCPEIMDLALECFDTGAQWGSEEWIPIDKKTRPEVINRFIKKLCDKKGHLQKKEATVYDKNLEAEKDYVYLSFFGIDAILAKVFEDQDQDDLYKKFNQAIEQGFYPTYEFFKGME